MSDLLKVNIGGSSYLCKWESPYNVIGGRKYKTVVIGNREWLAENLDYAFSGLNISTARNTNPNGCYYNNDKASYGIDGTYKCGMLYNYYAVKYLEDHKSDLLPSGWRVPTRADFSDLTETVGYMQGNKIKATENSVVQGFPSANWRGTNELGFNAVPAGRFSTVFSQFGEYTYFLCFELSGSTSWSLQLMSGSNGTSGYTQTQYDMVSIRLVRNIQ